MEQEEEITQEQAEVDQAAQGDQVEEATALQPKAPQPQAPQQDSEEVPSVEEMQRAFVALTRKRQRVREREEAIARERGEIEAQRRAWAEREEALRRAREGDEAAAEALLGEGFLERIVRKRLDPQAAELDGRLRAELSARDQKIAELREALARIEQDRRQSAAREEQQQFVEFARASEDLAHLEPEEIIERAEALFQQHRRAGRSVTFAQLRDQIAEQERRALARYQSLLERRAASAAQRPQASAPGASPRQGPRTLTNREATAPPPPSEEEYPGVDPEDSWKIPLLRELEERLRRRLGQLASGHKGLLDPRHPADLLGLSFRGTAARTARSTGCFRWRAPGESSAGSRSRRPRSGRRCSRARRGS